MGKASYQADDGRGGGRGDREGGQGNHGEERRGRDGEEIGPELDRTWDLLG